MSIEEAMRRVAYKRKHGEKEKPLSEKAQQMLEVVEFLDELLDSEEEICYECEDELEAVG